MSHKISAASAAQGIKVFMESVVCMEDAGRLSTDVRSVWWERNVGIEERSNLRASKGEGTNQAKPFRTHPVQQTMYASGRSRQCSRIG